MNTAIQTHGLTKIYNGYAAVDDLELSVPEGAVYGFLGPNGAGKTTTLKMLTGMIKPNSGKIYFFGQKADFGEFEARKAVGFLPDVPGFYDWMTAEEYLAFSGNLFSLNKTELAMRTKELLELVGLTKEAKKRIGGFSRGMKQRLGIAQALINKPKILFLDEPVSALDPVGRKEVMEIISGLSGNMTVFFSTHVLSDVERVCDRVIIIDKGKKLLEDGIDNIKALNPVTEAELELDREIDENFITLLRSQSFVEAVEIINSRKTRITFENIDEAMYKIPALVSDNMLGIRRFVILEPTLEDIFVKVVNGK